MQKLLAILSFLVAPAAFAGVAQDHFLAATKNAVRVVIRNLEAKAVIADSEERGVIAKARDAIELVDPPADEPTWKLPSFCCAKYSISFRRPDGSSIEYVVKHEITAILAPDAHGLHDLTDIPLSANSQKALRALLTEKKRRSSH